MNEATSDTSARKVALTLQNCAKSSHFCFCRRRPTSVTVCNMFIAQIRLAAVEMTETRAGILRLIGVMAIVAVCFRG